MVKYVSYENGISGLYTERKMYWLYSNTVCKLEYPSYVGWKWDMFRSGVFEKVSGQTGER